MPLPAVSPGADARAFAERFGPLIREYNRTDKFAPLYAADTGSATAYAIAPVPGISKVGYVVGQLFTFKASNANTGTAPTLNVNGLGAGTITYPDGSALVPGDIAANGFYTVQVTATTPTFHLLSGTGGRSKLIQMVSTITGAVATGTTTIPYDDSIPQSGEGDQYMSLAITPKSSTSKLIIDVCGVWANSNATNPNPFIVALFQDSTASALAAVVHRLIGAGSEAQISLRYVMTSGTTSATTFKVRAGSNNAGTTTFNGVAGGRILGGAMASSIVITEMLP